MICPRSGATVASPNSILLGERKGHMNKLHRMHLLVIPAGIVAAWIAFQVAFAQVPTHTVTGGGTFISSGFPRFFGVDATDSGTSDFGKFQMSGKTPSSQTFGFNADVTCVKVVGSTAYLGGTARTGTGSDGADANAKVLRARLDDGSADKARVSLLSVGTVIPIDCFERALTTLGPGSIVNGEIMIRAVPVP